MKLAIPVLAVLAFVLLGAASAQAQSCSAFVTVQAYDAEGKMATVKPTRGNQKRYFPKPEGAPSDTTKIPKKCSKKVTKNPDVVVKPSGGRMSVTQFRSNFDGKMLNNLDDPNWVPGELQKLIDGKTTVVAVLRPARKRGDPAQMTTIYLPITEEELAEIARIESEAEDIE